MTLTEVLGADGAAADPGHIASIAARFDSVARDSDHARQLLSTGGPIQWIGQASELFDQHLSQLPTQLSKVSVSIGHAAGALWTYGNILEEILPQARNLSAQLDQTRSDLAVDRRLLSAATDPVQVKHFTQRITNLQSDERTARNRASALRSWLSEAAAACVDQLRQAGDAGMQNSWTRTLAADGASVAWVAGYVFNDVIKATETIGKLVIEPAATLISAVGAFAANPSWTTAAPMFRAAAGVTGEVALILTITALACSGFGTPVALGLIADASTLATGATLAMNADALVSDGAMMATGQKVSGLTVGGDVAGVVLSGAAVFDATPAGSLTQAGEHVAGEQVATDGAKLTLAQRVETRLASDGSEVQKQAAELRTLGKLDVLGKDPSGGLPIPLIKGVSSYVQLKTVPVPMRVLIISSHVLDTGSSATGAVQSTSDFVTTYGKTVNP
jgi:hypothetical protein